MLCGAVVAAAPRKRPGCRRRVAWLEGTDRGGAESLFFGERTARTEVSAGRWLLSRSEDGRVPAADLLVGGNGPRRGGEPLFRGEAGSDTFPVATAIRCYRPLLAFPLLAACLPAACHHLIIRCCLHPRRFSPAAPAASLPAACVPAACRPLLPPLSASPLLPAVPPLLSSRTSCLSFPPPCAGRADGWAAAAPRVVGRDAMRRRREVLRNNLENRKILPIFVSVKYRGSGLSRPGFLFFIGLSFLWQKRLSI